MPSPSLETETGYSTNPFVWAGGYPYDISEPAPELQWPFSIQVFDRMRRTDAQVSAARKAIRLPILAAPWRIDPNGAREPVVKLVSEDLGIPILGREDETVTARRQRGRFSWTKHLAMALLALDYGHMGFEQVYQIINGQARLQKLAPRMPSSIAKMNVDQHGELSSVEQWPTGQPGAASQKPIAASRLVWYVHEQEAANFQGNSILRSAYKHWLEKDKLIRVNSMTIQRNGMGQPVYEQPPGATPADLQAGLAAMKAMRAHEQAGVSIPNGAHISMEGVRGHIPDAIASINYHDESIARNVLAQFINLGATRTGSRALGDSFIDFFKLGLDAIAGAMADEATAQIIEDLVDLNWGPDEPAPRMLVSEVDVEADLPPDSLVALATAGIIVADDALETYTRDRYNLPQRDGSPARTIKPLTKVPSLVAQPVLASAKPNLTHGSMPEPFATVYNRRAALQAKHRTTLAGALTAFAGAVDKTQIVTETLSGQPGAMSHGPVFASTQPTDPTTAAIAAQAAAQALQDATGTKPGSYLRLVGQDGIAAGQAEGRAAAQTLIDYARGTLDPTSFDVEFRTALDAIGQLGDLGGPVDDWLAATLGSMSRNIGEQLAQGIADQQSRADLEAIVGSAVDDPELYGPILDQAISVGLSRGSLDLYASEQVGQVDWITAADSRVDAQCDDYAANGPYDVLSAPAMPAHFGCRCSWAANDDSIRALLTLDAVA